MIYATKTEGVIALRKQGLTSRAIAAQLGIEVKNVTALEHSAGRARKPRPAEQMGRTVLFAKDVLDALAPHAAKRGLHPNTLARRIVETVVDEGMIDAVLDDGAANG